MLPLRPPMLEFLLRTVVKLLVFTQTFILRKLQSHIGQKLFRDPTFPPPQSSGSQPGLPLGSARPPGGPPQSPRPPVPEKVDQRLCPLLGAPSITPPHRVGPFSPWRTSATPSFSTALLLQQPCF